MIYRGRDREIPRCDVLATLDGAKISYVACSPGEVQSFLSPPGRLELVIERGDRSPERMTRAVVPGEPLELDIRLNQPRLQRLIATVALPAAPPRALPTGAAR